MPHDNGVAGQVGAGPAREATFHVALLDGLPVSSPPTREQLRVRRQTFEALPPPVLDRLLDERPAFVGSYVGAPVAVRCAANKRVIRRRRAAVESADDADRAAYLDTLAERDWLVPPLHPTAMSVEVTGDPEAVEAADAVLVSVAAGAGAAEAESAARRLARRVAALRRIRKAQGAVEPAVGEIVAKKPLPNLGEVEAAVTTGEVPVISINFPEFDMVNPAEEVATVLAVREEVRAERASRPTTDAPELLIGGIAEGAVPALRAAERASFDGFLAADPAGRVLIPLQKVEPVPARTPLFTRVGRALGRGR